LARASLLVLAAAAGVLAAPGPAAACNLWAHPQGHDRAEGTPRAPLRSITRMMDRLEPGQTGCLAPGTIFRESVVIRRSGLPGRVVRLRTGGGTKATIHGGITIQGSDVAVGGLRVRGLGDRRRAVVLVRGNRAAIVRNDVTGRDIVTSTPCVLVDGVDGTLIDGNSIGRCTRQIQPNIYAAGIHVANATGTTIAHNSIVRTPGDAIALGPNAQRTLVSRNHLHGNAGGVYLSGDGRAATSEALVVDNVISYSGRFGVHGNFPGVPSYGNLVTGNCLWKAAAGNIAGGGFTVVGNIVASPRYANRFRSLRMRPGPCRRLRPASRRRAAASVAPGEPLLAKFLVHYHLRGLPGRVQVVKLSFTRMLPGASVGIRCVRNCRAAERRTAGARGRAGASGLRGRWLSRGAVLEVRATKPGWRGAYARVIVTGLPKGVRIVHGCLGAQGRRVLCRSYARS
jgi:Right handed beta helix region